MKVGDHICLKQAIVRVYNLSSNNGLIIERVPSDTGYPNDFYVLVNGSIHLMGFAIEHAAEVINESR